MAGAIIAILTTYVYEKTSWMRAWFPFFIFMGDCDQSVSPLTSDRGSYRYNEAESHSGELTDHLVRALR